MPILNWLTRDEDIRTAQHVPYRLLEEVPDLSAGDGGAGNMLIQGDNLEALKALLPFYAGRVKCIYIDPPYNTRSAFEHYDDGPERRTQIVQLASGDEERNASWPNFSPAEIACRGTGKLLVNEPALDKLQALRDRLGKPLIVRSAYRSPEHNRAVSGATRSKHLDGAAFDIGMENHDPVAFEAAAREVGFLGFGFYPRSGFIHVDLGPARQWGGRFPVRATAFAEETPPAREDLAHSRTMRGGGAAGAATLGAAGIELAQSVLAETQSAILPLVPYLDTLRWMFIAVALGGIAVTIYARLDDWKRGRR